MMDIKTISAKGEYNKMEADREAFLNRAKEASKLTVPQLFPDAEDTSTVTYPTPFQSLGARGVNNLANKIVLSLFPPATAFFKLDANQAAKEGANVTDGQLQKAMQTVEKALVDDMEASQLRPRLVDSAKQGIVGGSSLIYIPLEGNPKTFSMRQFGVKRSRSGVVLRLVVKEQVSFLELESEVQNSIPDLTDKERSGEKPLDLFTLCVLDENKMYQVIQEIKGAKIAGSEGSYKMEEFPYIFVPFVDRLENYGRSYVEDYIGDLQSYEGLRKAILEASAESARIIYLVKPNAVLTPKKLQSANSGDVIQGSADDVATLQADKRLDLQIAQQEADILRQDLATVFLLDSAVRRNAERVTAEEIRRVSQELETALGGVYATQANTVQKPLVRLYLKRLVKKGYIKDILKNNLDLQITTGSAALGRGTEFNSIQQFLAVAREVLGDQFSAFIKTDEALKRVGYSLDVNTAGLVKSEEELQAEQAMQHQQQLEQQAVSPAINAAAKQEQQGQ